MELTGVVECKIANIEVCVDILKKAISIIEKINYVFENANVIINHHDFDCVNITGLKNYTGIKLYQKIFLLF